MSKLDEARERHEQLSRAVNQLPREIVEVALNGDVDTLPQLVLQKMILPLAVARAKIDLLEAEAEALNDEADEVRAHGRMFEAEVKRLGDVRREIEQLIYSRGINSEREMARTKALADEDVVARQTAGANTLSRQLGTRANEKRMAANDARALLTQLAQKAAAWADL